jgi:lysophospholipase L1-like esterase
MKRWLWLSLGIVLSGCAPREQGALPLLQLHNGDMEQGTDAPAAWGGDWVGYKRRALSRDTQTRHGGKAALRFHLTASKPVRVLEQVINGGAGRSVVLSGWVKTEGAIRAQVGLIPYGAGGRALPQAAALVMAHPSHWAHFSQLVTLPPETLCFSVALRAQGAGTVWLDDLQLSGERVETVPVAPHQIPPPEHQEPTRAYPGQGETWYETHQRLKNGVHAANPSVVFLGDSLTWRWQSDGFTEWERAFQPLGALNLGLEGDRTSQVLWRIQDGTLAGLYPKVVVLAVGINNLIRDTYPPERVAAGVIACQRAILAACPTAKVLVVGIFPSEVSATHPIRVKIRRVNALLAAHCPQFLELGPVFLETDGTLTDRVFYDHIHPSPYGYRLYREHLLPQIQRLLKS